MAIDTNSEMIHAAEKNTNQKLLEALGFLNYRVYKKTGESYSYALADMSDERKLAELIAHRLTLLYPAEEVNLSDYAFHFEHSGALE